MAEWGWGFVQTFIGAGFGTAAMTAMISIWRDRGQRQSEAAYLALRLAVAFERYTADCNDLIMTNNNAWTLPDEPFPDWTTTLPSLAPYPTDGEGWKALSAELASDCLNLPNRIRESQNLISEVIEYHEEDAGDAVEEEACNRGLEAWALAARLRSKYKIKAADPTYDYVGRLERVKQKLEVAHQEHLAREREIFASVDAKMPPAG